MTKASKAANATATSDGWVATQASDHPKIAWLRLIPCSAEQPEPGRRLLHGHHRRRGNTRSGALHDVSAHGGHIAQLAGCREQEPLGNHRKALAQLQVRCHIAHAGECADAQGAVRSRLDVAHTGQTVDVEQTIGKVRGPSSDPAGRYRGYERKLAVARVSRDGVRGIFGAR